MKEKSGKKKEAPVRKTSSQRWSDRDETMLKNLVAKRMKLLPVLGQEIIDLVNAAQEPPKAKAAGTAAA